MSTIFPERFPARCQTCGHEHDMTLFDGLKGFECNSGCGCTNFVPPLKAPPAFKQALMDGARISAQLTPKGEEYLRELRAQDKKD